MKFIEDQPQSQPAPERHYSAKELAKEIGVSASYIYSEIHAQRLKAEPFGLRGWIIRQSAVDSFRAEGHLDRLRTRAAAAKTRALPPPAESTPDQPAQTLAVVLPAEETEIKKPLRACPCCGRSSDILKIGTDYFHTDFIYKVTSYYGVNRTPTVRIVMRPCESSPVKLAELLYDAADCHQLIAYYEANCIETNLPSKSPNSYDMVKTINNGNGSL